MNAPIIEIRFALYIAETKVPAGPRLWHAPAPCPIEFSFPANKEGMALAKTAQEQLQKHINTWKRTK